MKRTAITFLFITAVTLTTNYLVTTFGVAIYRVKNHSMNDALNDGDRILIRRFDKERIKRNDIVVFESKGTTLVKRCIGLPGDTICIKSGKIFVNSYPIEPVAFHKKTAPSDTTNEFLSLLTKQTYGVHWDVNEMGPILIPKKGSLINLTPLNRSIYNHILNLSSEKSNNETTLHKFKNNYYFFIGDNRPVSVDSRSFGLVPSSAILGPSIHSFYSSH